MTTEKMNPVLRRLTWLLIQGYEVRIKRDPGQSVPFSRGGPPVEHIPVEHCVHLYREGSCVRAGKGRSIHEALKNAFVGKRGNG